MCICICNIKFPFKIVYFKNTHTDFSDTITKKFCLENLAILRMQFTAPLVPVSSSACALTVNTSQERFLCTPYLQVPQGFT